MSWKDKFNAAERTRDGDGPEEEYEGSLYAYYKGMKWWKTIVEGFKVLAKTYLPTLIIFVSLAIIFALISTFAMTEFNWRLTLDNEQITYYMNTYSKTDLSLWPAAAQEFYSVFRKRVTWNNVLNLFINYFSVGIGGVLTSHYILETAKGNKINLFDAIKHTFRGDRISVVLISTLILTLLIAAGFSFFFIFGVIILIMIGLCIPTLVDSNLGTKEVLNQGFKLAKDFRLRTTILMIVAVAFFSFFGDFLARVFFREFTNAERFAWLDPVTRDWGALLYVNLLNFITTSVFQPILFTFLAVHYLELTVQKQAKWFNYAPLTEKKPLKLKARDIFPNAAIFGMFLVISLVISVDAMIGIIKARLAA